MRGLDATPSEGGRPHTHTPTGPTRRATDWKIEGFFDPDERRAFCSLAPSLLRKGLER